MKDRVFTGPDVPAALAEASAALGLPEIELDEIWRCTTCGSCPQRCPRGVEQIEVGVAIRRLATAYEVFPGSVKPVRGVSASLHRFAAGVDVDLRKYMWTLVEKLRASGVTIILTTHYIEEAEAIADRVEQMKHEQVNLDGQLEKFNSDITQLQSKLNDAKTRQRSIVIRHNTASSQLSARKHIHSDRLDEMLFRFENAERRIDRVEAQRESLQATINACCEAEDVACVVDASPARLDRMLDLQVPLMRVEYHFVQLDGPPLDEKVLSLLAHQ